MSVLLNDYQLSTNDRSYKNISIVITVETGRTAWVYNDKIIVL